MDRIAVISDVHGNLPALNAVLADIHSRDVPQIVCLGDLVGKGPSPALTIDIVRDTCDVVLMGNWDDMVARGRGCELVSWTRAQLNQDHLDYLMGLDFCLDFVLSGRRVRLLHSSPHDVHQHIYDHAPLEQLLTMFSNTPLTGGESDSEQPDIVGYGDIHATFIRSFETHQNRILFNAGSVGNPLDSTLASYAILEGRHGQPEDSSFSVNFVRVAYDIELAVSQATQARMPGLAPYIDELRTATYRAQSH